MKQTHGNHSVRYDVYNIFFGVGLTVGFFFTFIFLNSCQDRIGTIEVLQKNGYTNIEITGPRPAMRGQDDFYSTGFKAKTMNGEIVTGAVTSGFFKGKTIRFD